MSIALQQTAFAFFSTIAFILLLARLAPVLKLVDEPDHRKQHSGSIPVVGGIAILLTLIISALMWQGSYDQALGPMGDRVWIFIAAAAALTVLGGIDDAIGVSVLARTVLEICVAFFVIENLNLLPRNLGDLVGLGNIYMQDSVAYPFTVIAIYGITNAYNMLDGIDGLLAIMVLITIGAFHAFTGLLPGLISLTVSAALIAFLVSNLKTTRFIPKTFLGDAGSKLLGFIVVSLILTVTSSQISGTRFIEPVTALYLVGLPLFDMVFTTLRRVFNRKSPFASDRGHIHHLMQELDISNRKSLWLIGFAGLTPVIVGLFLDRTQADASQQFLIFITLFITYCVFMSQAWQVATRYQDMKTKTETPS